MPNPIIFSNTFLGDLSKVGEVLKNAWEENDYNSKKRPIICRQSRQGDLLTISTIVEKEGKDTIIHCRFALNNKGEWKDIENGELPPEEKPSFSSDKDKEAFFSKFNHNFFQKIFGEKETGNLNLSIKNMVFP